MKKNLKDLVILCIVLSVCAAIVVVALYLRANPADDLTVAMQTLTHDIACVGIGLTLSILIAGMLFPVLFALDTAAVKTAIRLASNRLSARIQAKNAAQIFPCLQVFLFDVLNQNKDTLHLRLGQDASCLTPQGCHTTNRKGCLFYTFSLIVPDAPEMDCATLRQIIQQHIWAELYNYGIAGLHSYYQDHVHGATPTVYLDRVQYDETQHLLRFSVLYIATPEASRYAWDAYQNRDKAKVEIEPEVYDDDI